MHSIDDTALREALEQLPAMCPAFAGAVVATRDGLVLAAVGDYGGDTPAACAASLSVHLEDDLQPLREERGDPGLQEALFFGRERLWHLSRLDGGHLLLVGCGPTPHVGALRLAGQTAAQRLNRWLSPAEQADT